MQPCQPRLPNRGWRASNPTVEILHKVVKRNNFLTKLSQLPTSNVQRPTSTPSAQPSHFQSSHLHAHYTVSVAPRLRHLIEACRAQSLEEVGLHCYPKELDTGDDSPLLPLIGTHRCSLAIHSIISTTLGSCKIHNGSFSSKTAHPLWYVTPASRIIHSVVFGRESNTLLDPSPVCRDFIDGSEAKQVLLSWR